MMRLFTRPVGTLLIAGLFAFFASGCSGGAGVATSPLVSPQSNVAAPRTLAVVSAAGNVTFTIGIARKVSTSGVTPKFVSPSTQSLLILTDGLNPVLLNLTASSPHCSPNPAVPGGRICRVSLSVPTGNHVFTVTAYDLVNAGGHVLSTNTSGSVFVKPAGTTTVTIVLQGVVQRVMLGLATTNPPVGKTASIGLTAVLEDADGNLIVGPANYEYPVTLTTSDPTNGRLSKTTLHSPADVSGITVAYSGADVSSIIFSATTTASLAQVTIAVLTPSGVGATRIYVTNNLTSALTIYNAAGAQSAPPITAGLNNPFGVAVDTAGKIYVANGNLGSVTTYNPDGTQSTPTFTANLSSPRGVAVDESGFVYVANPGVASNVQGFNAAGFLLYSFTDGLGGISFPAGVAVHNGTMYVADQNLSKLDVYSVSPPFNGVRLATITANLSNPTAVAVDTAGKIYVANAGNSSITTYNKDGSVGTPTIRAGVDIPSGVAVDRAGKIYVSNHGTNTVTTYNPDGSQTTPTITGLNGANGIAVR